MILQCGRVKMRWIFPQAAMQPLESWLAPLILHKNLQREHSILPIQSSLKLSSQSVGSLRSKSGKSSESSMPSLSYAVKLWALPLWMIVVSGNEACTCAHLFHFWDSASSEYQTIKLSITAKISNKSSQTMSFSQIESGHYCMQDSPSPDEMREMWARDAWEELCYSRCTVIQRIQLCAVTLICAGSTHQSRLQICEIIQCWAWFVPIFWQKAWWMTILGGQCTYKNISMISKRQGSWKKMVLHISQGIVRT